MMLLVFVFCIFNLLLSKSASNTSSVLQTPPFITKRTGESVVSGINCSHNNDDYDVILWYKQEEQGSLKFLGYLYVKMINVEDFVRGKISFNGDGRKNSSLDISTLSVNDSGVYFCAARDRDYNPAYFGSGTRLTVLEPGHDITTPTVKVLPPSKKECKGKDNKRKKTLVCVASKFYPDHVSITWKINGETISKGVATDNAALRLGKYYKITSRLRVSAKEWFTPDRNFTCIVNFYNGKNYDDYSDSIFGVEAEDTGSSMTREKFLKITQMGKLSYGIFIAKSSLYGAFVLFLVWKLQGSKRNR